ncbi:dihydroorotate dehydrogenase B (NAD(+)), electron transfer subunit [Pullulanibacillus camelliae]|uniref:Dihydroorotate dehydrogenase B (NAD(+)), electron transfer subunit n=2 Tax=Pullulanibacillus camelliae TaxID=1707096 RepID=A0A8J2VX69_9BACL|nr:dihydroorotate dehydrogenase B (NAD(+)), electron transfer subunit [Pullulanibacillus camelliae]
MQAERMRIVSHKVLAQNIYEMTLEGELVQHMSDPGQFVHLRVDEHGDTLLRRPISLADYDKEMRQCTLIYRAEGQGTAKLAAKRSGEGVDVLGPLGNGFPIPQDLAGEQALVIGGGVGVPPLYNLSKQLQACGAIVTHVLGFASADVAFYEDRFKQLGATYVATVDGSQGKQGFVTDILSERAIAADRVYACGPLPMLRALEERYVGSTIPLYISLEQRMACGIGACMACVCHLQEDPTGLRYKKICRDGPVFKAGEVVLT